jgi:hypothetical protein
MIELEFLPQLYMNARLRKPHIITTWICTEFSQALLIPYESFVILLKSRSHTHHPYRNYSYTGSRRQNMPSIQIHLKLFYSYTRRKHQKYIPYKLPQNKCSKFLLLPLKYFHCNREAWAMQKLLKKRKYWKKWTSVRINKTMGTWMPA